jgi:hypothetical protein
MKCLPVQLAHALEPELAEEQWLVEKLWGDGAVGIVGGEPKCCKSFLALELAVAVASGRPCLGRYRVDRAGPVLLFAAEDSTRIVRTRLAGIAAARGTSLEALDIHVIVAPSVRLDLDRDRELLWNTVATLRPRLLVLDPFVRLHRIDENASEEVAPLLAYLREMNRAYRVAVAVVHHAKKGGGGLRAGQSLRGSSEFHAWGDSNLYLARRSNELTLQVEHRAAASIDDLKLELRPGIDAMALALELTEEATSHVDIGSPDERVVAVLRSEGRSMKVAELRRATRMRMQTLVDVLRRLVDGARVARSDEGSA